MIRSIYEDGYSWVEVDDASWQNATMTLYWMGYPRYV